MKNQIAFNFEIDCQNCGKDFTVNSKDVGKSVKCPHCQAVIHLEDNGYSKGVKKNGKAT